MALFGSAILFWADSPGSCRPRGRDGLEGVRLYTAMMLACSVPAPSMMIGIGAYAPIMVMVNLLGMNTKAAFPIMMGLLASF